MENPVTVDFDNLNTYCSTCGEALEVPIKFVKDDLLGQGVRPGHLCPWKRDEVNKYGEKLRGSTSQ